MLYQVLTWQLHMLRDNPLPLKLEQNFLRDVHLLRWYKTKKKENSLLKINHSFSSKLNLVNKLINITSFDAGCKAYWILHSPTTPKCRITFIAVRLSILYSSLDNVWLGATTIDSPVWIPRGSKFSMLHTLKKMKIKKYLILSYGKI